MAVTAARFRGWMFPLFVSKYWKTPPGMPSTIPAKMMSEMPLPMPRSVICSPTHMMKAVPVVSVSMLMHPEAPAGVRHDIADARRVGQVAVVQRLEAERHPEGLHSGQDDRPVARVLVDLPGPLLALLAQLLERLPHHRQELQDDARADVRHDAEGEDRQVAQRAAAEHVEQTEQPAPCLETTAAMTFRSTPGIVTKTPTR